MNNSLLWFPGFVISLCLASVSFGKDQPKFFEVPGGGRLIYEDVDASTGQFTALLYSGSAEWLVSQKDEESHWEKFPALYTVQLSHTTVTREEMEYIATLKTVKSFEVPCTQEEITFPGEALPPLGNMPQLKNLQLAYQDGFTSSYWTFLDKLTALESLDIWPGIIDEETFGRICGLKQLRHLSVYGLETSPENASRLANLQLLETVRLGEIKDAASILKALVRDPKLRDLSFRTPHLGRDDLKLIASMPNLEELALEGESIRSLPELKSLQKLKRLMLDFHDAQESDRLKFLANLPALEDLMLRQFDLREFSLEGLRGHKKLAELYVSTIELHDDDIAILESMPNLKKVWVGNKDDSKWTTTANTRLPGVFIAGRKN